MNHSKLPNIVLWSGFTDLIGMYRDVSGCICMYMYAYAMYMYAYAMHMYAYASPMCICTYTIPMHLMQSDANPDAWKRMTYVSMHRDR